MGYLPTPLSPGGVPGGSSPGWQGSLFQNTGQVDLHDRQERPYRRRTAMTDLRHSQLSAARAYAALMAYSCRLDIADARRVREAAQVLVCPTVSRQREAA